MMQLKFHDLTLLRVEQLRQMR